MIVQASQAAMEGEQQLTSLPHKIAVCEVNMSHQMSVLKL